MDRFSKRVFLFAFVLRLIPVLLSFNLGIGLDDMFQYDMLARSLAAGQGYRWYAEPDLKLIQRYIDIDVDTENYDPRGLLTSFRAPAYPVFLALIYLVSGLERRFFAARLVQAALGALLAPMAYALGRRVFPERLRIATFGGIAVAAYPMLVVFPLALATENLFLPSVLGATLLTLRAGESGATRAYAFAGITFGLAALTRSIAVALVPLAMAWAWWLLRQRKGALVLGACALAVTIPWAMRNTLLHGRLTYIETSMGYNLYLGYHPEGDGSFKFGISLDLLTILDDAERDRAGTQAALGFIRDDPGRVPELILLKLGHFFGLEDRALMYFYSNNFLGPLPPLVLGLVFLIFGLPFALLATLAAVGLPFIEWTKEQKLLAWLAAAYLLPHILIMAEERFHLALVPFIALWAGWAWVNRTEIWTGFRTPTARRLMLLSLALVALLWLNWGLELARDADKLAVLFGPDGNLARFDY